MFFPSLRRLHALCQEMPHNMLVQTYCVCIVYCRLGVPCVFCKKSELYRVDDTVLGFVSHGIRQ